MNEQMKLDLPGVGPAEAEEYKSALLDLIPHGEENAVSMKTLASVLNIECRSVRQMVLDARIKGAVICSSSAGYFQPETHEELFRYVQIVKAQERSKYRALISAEKVLNEGRLPHEEDENG